MRALKSVHAQTFLDYEVLIVDDGSTDESLLQLQELKQQLKPTQNWHIISQQHSGVSVARNNGVAHAQGQWIAFLDSDDEWIAQKLEKQMAYLEHNKECHIVYNNEVWVRNGKKVNPPQKHKKGAGNIFLASTKECLIGCSTVVMKKTLFQSVGGFRPDFIVCEDYDLWLKITAQHDVGYISETLTVKYGGRSDQLSNSIKCMDHYRVMSLQSILSNRFVRAQDKKDIYALILQKCEILLNGYLKHKNMQNYQDVFELKEKMQLLILETS